MSMGQELTFSGAIPANLLPCTPDDAFDEGDYRRHLTWLAEALSQAGLFEPAVAN